jgi:adenylyltransferase/sulfurtransferase
MLIDGWGEESQARLKASSVFIAGAGGLGSPVSIYLAVAGIGEIRICDSGEMFFNSANVERQSSCPECGGLQRFRQ